MAATPRSLYCLRALLVALALFTFGCEKPPVVNGVGSAVEQSGVTVTVTSAELIRPEFEGTRGSVVSEAPVMKLEVNLTNNGETPVTYDLGWSQTVSTQAQSIVVFAGSDPELAVSEENQIPTIDFTQIEYLDDPVTEPKTVAPGTSVDDVILFEAPADGTSSLLVSIPPSLFPDSDLPAYIVLPWSPNEVPALPSVAQGEDWEGRTFTFKVTDISTEWTRLQDPSDEPGISDEPLVKVAFEVTNTGEEDVTYRPTRERGAIAFPALLQPDGSSVPRATFDSSVEVVGQLDERQQIAAGETLSDYMLFRRPPQGISDLTFVFPGKRVGGTGQVRVSLTYNWATPEKPEEWRPPAPDTEEGEDGEEGAGE